MGVEPIEGYPGVEQRALPPVLARVDEQADAPPPGEKGIQRRTIAGDEREREIVSPADAQHETQVIAACRPLGDGKNVGHIRTAGDEAFGAGEDEHVDLRAGPRGFERADDRGRKQHIADAACHDDQNALRRRRECERTWDYAAASTGFESGSVERDNSALPDRSATRQPLPQGEGRFVT